LASTTPTREYHGGRVEDWRRCSAKTRSRPFSSRWLLIEHSAEELAISARPTAGRITSERRAAIARADGAKSRGPVTAQGRANSSRNGRSHGIRSRILLTDPASIADLASQLAFENDFAPDADRV